MAPFTYISASGTLSTHGMRFVHARLQQHAGRIVDTERTASGIVVRLAYPVAPVGVPPLVVLTDADRIDGDGPLSTRSAAALIVRRDSTLCPQDR